MASIANASRNESDCEDAADGASPAAELAGILAQLGPVADRLGSRAAIAQYEADIGDPAKTRAGSSFAGRKEPLPRFIPVRDIVRISYNIYSLLPADAILQRMARSTRLPTDDNLTNSLPYASTLRAALELGTRYNNVMLPWFRSHLEEAGDEIHVIYRPVAPLGRIEALSTELSLASVHRIVEIFVGQQVAQARVHFALQPESGLSSMVARFACPILIDGGESHMAIPLAWCDRPSPYADARLWAEGLALCEADIRFIEDAPMASRVRTHIEQVLKSGRVATIAHTADELGLSIRSLVRALGRSGTTHHTIVDAERRQLAQRMLAQPAVPISEIAERLGFSDQSSFGRKCRAWFGESPSRTRARLSGDKCV